MNTLLSPISSSDASPPNLTSHDHLPLSLTRLLHRSLQPPHSSYLLPRIHRINRFSSLNSSLCPNPYQTPRAYTSVSSRNLPQPSNSPTRHLHHRSTPTCKPAPPLPNRKSPLPHPSPPSSATTSSLFRVPYILLASGAGGFGTFSQALPSPLGRHSRGADAGPDSPQAGLHLGLKRLCSCWVWGEKQDGAFSSRGFEDAYSRMDLSGRRSWGVDTWS